ncbi:hypothetical protein A3D00_00555 [Candidatus Woesebacteria bacterium RIFCSPHIGHO2_02_FULL_38_9]|uniref:Uncharacterized protein n=1 Tax=Candidatus Woesebacteria bacterium RIFCSPHIGHO2_01_FULL_39_28 TaxID=1802496 RepID=A0A1F7YJG0_9BACT|nr:MAG: hypothetical protein A2627_04145 [Candidatus Woesebacteria bacterium RIFCSPHIGHO2_01_FULL_39_28]OGM33221.1 MAG: hypothetical protein A3D00_00555 [Candidatus Woesebacteria bacterium RIFCSPHIGHO2_02_FULL_38_9]OGM58686.1 MAG: hypothetical protein A3A50_02800 [Candidatus Woesebacteria bacterium RIFCSPLOWO2_01_FULL_38_20]
MDESNENQQKDGVGKPTIKVKSVSLAQAVDLGEYDPKYLSTFSEWSTLSAHVQLQYIRAALDNRRKQLLSQWAEVNNMLDFRLKPQLHTTLKNIEKQLNELEDDREEIYAEYSKKF